MNAEPEWINYLQTRFPNQEIEVLNFFSTRSIEELEEKFENVEYVTFSTTFTSTDWFKNLLTATCANNKIIGFCHDQNGWDLVKKEILNSMPIEIVDTIR